MSEEKMDITEWEKRATETDPRVISNMTNEVESLMAEGVDIESAILRAMQQAEKDAHMNAQEFKGVQIKNSGKQRLQILDELERRGKMI